MKKILVLTFDPYKTDAKALHQLIKNNSDITGWWHYLGSTYLLTTNKSLDAIHKSIMSQWPRQRYLLVEVDIANSNGWLPKAAWPWIHKQRNSK